MLRAQSVGVREIARRLGRSPSTISRELTRNAATRSGRLEYRASVAQWKAELVANRLQIDFPEDKSMRISHEATYQALYIQGRGDLVK